MSVKNSSRVCCWQGSKSKSAIDLTRVSNNKIKKYKKKKCHVFVLVEKSSKIMIIQLTVRLKRAKGLVCPVWHTTIYFSVYQAVCLWVINEPVVVVHLIILLQCRKVVFLLKQLVSNQPFCFRFFSIFCAFWTYRLE